MSAIARAVDLAPDALRRLLDGGTRGSGSRRLPLSCVTAGPERPGGGLTRAQAHGLLRALVSGLPAARQLAGIRKLIGSLHALYGDDAPEWLIGLQPPVPGPKPRIPPALADPSADRQARAAEHEEVVQRFRAFVRDELSLAGLALDLAEEVMAEVFRR